MCTVRICTKEITKHIYDGFTLKFLLVKSMLVTFRLGNKE
jgi:hypothetical protein